MLRMIDLRDIDSDSLLLARTWEMRNHGASWGASRGLGVSQKPPITVIMENLLGLIDPRAVGIRKFVSTTAVCRRLAHFHPETYPNSVLETLDLKLRYTGAVA